MTSTFLFPDDSSALRIAGRFCFGGTDEANLLGVDFTTGPKVRDACFGVRRKISGRRRSEGSAGFSDAAVVRAENGNAAARQIVGENQKWAVAHEALVPILWT